MVTMALSFKEKQVNFKSAFKMGTQAEKDFANILLNNYNIESIHGTTAEDKRGIDYKLLIDDKTYTVDVKASKKLRRGDKHSNMDLVYLELENSIINSKYKGWLYHKDTDYFAFQNNGDFYLVQAKVLRKYIHEHIDLDMRPLKTSAIKFLTDEQKINRLYYRHDYNNKTSNNNNNYSYDLLCLVSFDLIKHLLSRVFYA